MTATWLEEVQQRISHLRERVTKAPEASKADLEMMVDRIANSFKVLAATAEDASNEAKAGDSKNLLGTLHGLRVQGQQAVSALKTELRFIENNLEAIKPDEPRSDVGRPISVPHTLRSRPGGAAEEGHGMRRLKDMDERSAPTGEDLAHDIWREIGRWLEDEEELELGDINEDVTSQNEQKVLSDNIAFIVHRDLEKKLGSGAARGVTVEIQKGYENYVEENEYRAFGDFRIWYDQDSAAQGSFGATGDVAESDPLHTEGNFVLQNMTINITQASGHGKHNDPIRFFG